MTRNVKHYVLFDALASPAISKIIDVRDWVNCVVCIASSKNSTGKVLCCGAELASDYDKSPDFTTSPTTTNRYSYLQMVNLDTGALVNGTNGWTIADTGADVVSMFEVNINAVDYLTFDCNDIKDGTLTITLTCTDSE